MIDFYGFKSVKIRFFCVISVLFSVVRNISQ